MREVVALEMAPNEHNAEYLSAKAKEVEGTHAHKEPQRALRKHLVKWEHALHPKTNLQIMANTASNGMS